MKHATANTRVDDVLRALKHPERRWILRNIATQSPTDVRNLAQDSVARDADETYDSYRRAHVSLKQIHLPILDDVGAIEYDPDSEHIAIKRGFSEALAAAIFELETIQCEVAGAGDP